MTSYATPRWFRSAVSLAILACGVLLQQAASAATITVTTATDADSLVIGRTTLRQAITTANRQTSDDVIVFDIPAGQDRTIDLTSELPHLTSNISIINRGDPITVRRSISFRTPQFRIFTITPGNTVAMEGLIITRGAGGISNRGSTLSMRNCTLHLNTLETTAGGGGGAIDNYAESGGPAARLVLRNCTLTENRLIGQRQAGSGGGAIRNYAAANSAASATLVDCVLRQNSTRVAQLLAPPGGAIANVSHGEVTLTMTGCTIEDNSVDTVENHWLGGGIFNSPQGLTAKAMLTMKDCTLRNNWAGSGGALYNITGYPEYRENAVVTLENCTLSGNRALGPNGAAGGGAISNGGVLNLTNCTLSENVATIENSSLGGGAILIFGGPSTVTNCTFTGNRSERASSILTTPSGTITTANSIFDRDATDVHFVNEGSFTSRGHNICDDLAGGPFSTSPGGLLNAPGDRRGIDPGLLSLANNGGPTQTCALEQNSPAIDAGDDAIAPPTDQRGRARNGVSDIGAFERQDTIPVSLKPGRLGNIATRLMVETGDNALIGGFIVTGTEPKRVMVRAIGPSLPFANRLSNPTLELFDSSGASVEANDNWVDSPNRQAISDTTIPPTSDLESAIVVFLPAGGAGYTAVVRGVDGATGIGVVEVYDLDSAVDSKLANISTRGLVQTGDNVLIAGTIVTGQASQKVIIRAIGPSLPLAGKLEDPLLELFDANGALLAANDNWRTGGQEAEINGTGVPPSNESESAIVYQLPSNNASYTAIVRGVGGSTGIAVVEVYGLAQFSFPD